LCYDCRQRGLISASISPGNALPDAVLQYERGIDLLYFANALIVDAASRQLLEFSKLTPDGSNTTAMSACCGTLMCGAHPLYQGNSISVNADSCRVATPSRLRVQAIVFACDAPADRVEEMERRSPAPVIFDVYNELDHPALQAFVKAVTASVSEEARARSNTTFEALSAQRTITFSNACFEESRMTKLVSVFSSDSRADKGPANRMRTVGEEPASADALNFPPGSTQ